MTRRNDAGLLAAASFLLLMLAAAQGYVSFRAQYTFVDHAKHAPVPSILEALGLDTGAVIFALLGLTLACRGRRAAVERVLNVACALGSLAMNLLAADLGSPRSVTVWMLPSALYAITSDRLIAVMRRWVQDTDPETSLILNGSAWHMLSGLSLWFLRLVFDARGTLKGFRRWVLTAAPVAPGVRASAGQTATPDALPRGPERASETKRATLIRRYEQCGRNGDPRYGDRTKAAALAGEIAKQIGYHPGTARRELARYLTAKSEAGAVSQLEARAEPGEVA
jgi:DNA-binding transcriptional ArsR family regulator